MARDFSWQMPIVFLFVFALVAPAQNREAKSARECFDLSFNLMFLGAVLSAPVTAMANLAPDRIAEKIEKKRRSGWCDGCNCGDCDCCCCACEEGCCCDGCGCDGCDCCSCDC